MDFDSLSITHSFVHQVLPAALLAVAACSAWLWFCRRLYRAEERTWHEALRRPDGYEKASLDDQMKVLIEQRALAGRGSPADRLFLAGLAVASVFILLVLAIYRTW